jgi:thiamine-monophosphate kinase
MTRHVPGTRHERPTTISDLAERELIDRIQQRLPPKPSWLLVGIGDDAAVVEPERNRADVLTVDALVEGVHFDRAFVPPEAIGHRALAVNLSDLAAMGAAPRLALLSFALPPTLPVADFDAIVCGLTTLAAKYRVHVAGGNLTRTSGPLVIDVTAIGTVKRRQVLTRDRARAGDELYVSGTIGGAAAGLQMLRTTLATTEDTGDTATVSSLVESYLRPEPRVRLGTLLSRNRAATACIDLSDGLGDAVRQLADASGVGATIDAAALPIAPAARAWFESRGADALAESMASDDYELLIAVHPRTRGRLATARRHAGVPLTRIGVCTPERAISIRSNGADSALPAGYSHFGR